MYLKRTVIALAAGIAVSTAGFASASVLAVDGGTIQYGQDGVTCDTDGVKANWGLETNTNDVRSVRIDQISAACEGADMFVKVKGVPGDAKKIELNGDISQSVPLDAPVNPAVITGVEIWIEG